MPSDLATLDNRRRTSATWLKEKSWKGHLRWKELLSKQLQGAGPEGFGNGTEAIVIELQPLDWHPTFTVDVLNW